MLAALVGGGIACVFANRRLDQLPVPGAARGLEIGFVVIITMLRYDSLRVQGADLLAAAGAVALTALISLVGLLGIEEVLVETQTLAIFLGALQVSWRRWRRKSARARLARTCGVADAAGDKLQHNFLGFLLISEKMPLEDAQRRAAAFRNALFDGQAGK
jgi:hypothetical protein